MARVHWLFWFFSIPPCDRAEPGRVLVSDVVRQLVAGKGFAFEHLGAEKLKGFEEPVALYKVRIV